MFVVIRSCAHPLLCCRWGWCDINGHSPVQGNKRLTQRVAWLLGLSTRKITDGCLTTSTLKSDLRLRQLAVTLNFGNDDFPVHCKRITDFRYLCNGFLITLSRRL
jgi:hypothetical protein